MQGDRKILVGVILGAHGVRGDVRVRSFTSDPKSLFKFKAVTDESGKRVVALKHKGAAKGDFIVSLADVKDKDAADALRGTKLFVERAALPKTRKREYYEVDLVGIKVLTVEGKTLGEVQALHDYGAGPFLEINPSKGQSFMLPFNDVFVPDVDLESDIITAFIPEGWLSEEPKPKKGKSE